MFYLRVESSGGHNIAIVALARKLFAVVRHLLVVNEDYVEGGLKEKRRGLIKPSDLLVPFEEALDLLLRSGYVTAASRSKWMLS